MNSIQRAEEERLRKEAWIGDAVLALYIRSWILESFHDINGDLFIEFTSNDFLSRIGNATAVEAEIGRAYAEGGLDAGFAWIKDKLEPRIQERLKSLRKKGLKL